MLAWLTFYSSSLSRVKFVHVVLRRTAEVERLIEPLDERISYVARSVDVRIATDVQRGYWRGAGARSRACLWSVGEESFFAVIISPVN